MVAISKMCNDDPVKDRKKRQMWKGTTNHTEGGDINALHIKLMQEWLPNKNYIRGKIGLHMGASAEKVKGMREAL